MDSLGSLLMGQASGTISPATVARRRLLAQRLATVSSVKDAGLLGALSNGLGGALSGYEDTQAANEETSGQDSATKAIAKLLQNPNAPFSDLTTLASNPWLNQSQSGTVNSLIGKQIDQQFPQVTANQSDFNFNQTHPGFAAFTAQSGSSDLPSDVQTYNFYAKQETDAGRTPLSYMEFKQASGNNQGTTDDASAIAQAIVDGTQPPDTKGLYKLSGPIRAELAKKGFDYTKANEDWNATQKLLGSLNGTQQVRLRQAVQQTTDSLELVDQLAQQWKGSNYPTLNKASLYLASQGAPGFPPEAQSLATQLIAEINDVTSDLGTVYKGGNSSTDESLRLAASQLSADWSEATLRNAIALAKQNLAYRQNSLKLSTAGVENSQYGPQGPDKLAPANVGPSGVTSAPPAAVNYKTKYGLN